MVEKFIMEGTVSGSGQIGNIWNIEVLMDDLICDKVRSIKDFTKDWILEEFDGLVEPQSSTPYVQIGLIIVM